MPTSKTKILVPTPAANDAPTATVYFDGSCPLCRLEIDHYRRLDRQQALRFIDVSEPSAQTGADLERSCALARLHIRDGQGELHSGAAAFVGIWRAVPGWRWAARIAELLGALFLLEKSYRGFLKVRPFVSQSLRKRGW